MEKHRIQVGTIAYRNMATDEFENTTHLYIKANKRLKRKEKYFHNQSYYFFFNELYKTFVKEDEDCEEDCED